MCWILESAKAASPLWGNIEVAIVLLEVLGRYVFHNNLISYIAGRGGKVPSSPYMPTPELLWEFLVFGKELVRGFSFERLHEFGNWKVGRHRYEKMDMIFRYGTLDNFYILRLAYLSEKISQPFGYLSVKNLFPVLRDPHQMVLEVIYWMRGCPIILHIPSLLKSSPKGEGFSPRGRH